MRERFEPSFDQETEESKPEVAFKSPEERKVTDRTFGQYLESFSLPETELKSKTILDIGSGLSDFSSKTNEKFKDSGTIVVGLDPMYQNLGSNFEELKENAQKANMEWISRARASGSESAYKKTKDAPYKVAGSHQELPFANESFDLVLANNSITQYKDRGITRTALKEAIRVIKENGEIRILPADLRWDWKKESLYIHTFEAPTPETKEEAEKLGLDIGPDKEMFKILKEIEDAGINFYAVKKKSSVRRRMPGRFGRLLSSTGPSYSLILRKDSQLPDIEYDASLRKLLFKDSSDSFHVPSENLDSENK